MIRNAPEDLAETRIGTRNTLSIQAPRIPPKKSLAQIIKRKKNKLSITVRHIKKYTVETDQSWVVVPLEKQVFEFHRTSMF